MINVFSLQFDQEYVWEQLYHKRVEQFNYANKQEVYSMLQRVSQDIPSEEDIETILQDLDHVGYFLFSRQ